MHSSQMPTALDLFSGCGGLTLGLKQAGYSVVGAIEVDAKAQATYRLNHPEVKLFEQDIRTVNPNCVLSELGLKRGELDLLAGCPPCQGFSRLGTRNKQVSVSDPRNDLVNEFVRFVLTLLPRNIMLENVPALSRDARFQGLCCQLAGLGYFTKHMILDAASYGVPQRRKRLIMLASLDRVPSIDEGSEIRVTVRDAIGKLESPVTSVDALHTMPEKRSLKVRQLIAKIPKDGGSRKDIRAGDQLACHQRSDGFFDVYGRMAWDKVSPTITSGCHNPSKGRFLHPVEDRAITLREAALLQGFPSSYKFDVRHGKESIALMIGNALPPPFIAAHAAALKK